MNTFLRTFFAAAGLLTVFSATHLAQQVKRSPFDVTGYQIDAQLDPIENKLAATADVSFVPGEDTRSVTFELNGSLKVDSVSRVDRPASMPSTAAPVKGKAPLPAPAA